MNPTEIIRKGKAGQPTEFGKLVKLQEAENQIITAYQVYEQRPSDRYLLAVALAIREQRLERVPKLVARDAGFYSAGGKPKFRKWECGISPFPTTPPRAPSAGVIRNNTGSVKGRSGELVRKEESAY